MSRVKNIVERETEETGRNAADVSGGEIDVGQTKEIKKGRRTDAHGAEFESGRAADAARYPGEIYKDGKGGEPRGWNAG